MSVLSRHLLSQSLGVMSAKIFSEFIRNYKRAGCLNGWDDVNLSLGLPLYLKGHASAWFNTLPTPDEMPFDELS